MKIYAVVFSNYEPAEMDSLHCTREGAEKACDEANAEWRVRSPHEGGPWRVAEWTVEGDS